ncbi:MAG: hypothetical protein CM15mV25_0720 [uncultured marine virus]|nr:MAG: hypothetical protein CM15mV25_0720 [uncultured marine virus]
MGNALKISLRRFNHEGLKIYGNLIYYIKIVKKFRKAKTLIEIFKKSFIEMYFETTEGFVSTRINQ